MSSAYAYNLGAAYYDVARTHAERAALRCTDGEVVSHARLNELSNRLARALVDRGVGHGDVVCIFNRKSVRAFASMVACLKIGAIYCNLDTTSPAVRVDKMLSTCRPALILHDGPESDLALLADRHPDLALLSLQGDTLAQSLADASPDDLEETRAVTGSDPAYIMFTSGSTGVPKGAVMTHANVLNLVAWGRETFGVGPEDSLTNVNPAYFDNSVFDFYVSLFNGAALCPFGADVTRQPTELVKAIEALGCTIWFSVPSMLVFLLTMRALASDRLPTVHTFIFGGEGFPKSKLKQLYELFGDRSRLVNVYGPTECTCICSAHEIQAQDLEDLTQLAPLGHIAANFGYLIDPVSEDPNVGELLLFGPNVGLGYFDDAQTTALAFVPHPTDHRFHRPVYRTGDLVRRAEDGRLHFKGRVDNQIKHMGYRIELEEIEAAFSTLDYVDESAVVYKQDTSGFGYIAGYIGASTDVSEGRVLEDVKAILPPYMVPTQVHLMATLPKNRNGKIDRKVLQEQA